jgi:hypothetical protein
VNGKWTERERQVRLSQDICDISLPTLNYNLGKGKEECWGNWKGSEWKMKVRLSHDICGFSLLTLKQQVGRGLS